ncbi:nuclear receptor subfamily 4 group A member 3-like [Parasteatoda tepidariorum]|uniref:nuclear receptor subfamily 4 group A member 3-like n=1 Tax=Parasteatoda tepidariorum TaxID=114398 RepID=UPI00077FA30D|nr:protein hunchback-like [Parasteatoda tepidariorum]
MNSRTLFALLVACCVLSGDFITQVMAGRHHHNNQGIELLLAAGILAKLLRKKQHHHHHGHHHHGHHHHSGSGIVEMQVPAPMAGYTAQTAGAATTYSSSVEYPQMYPASSQSIPVPPMPYGAASAAGYIGFEPQPMAFVPPMMGP